MARLSTLVPEDLSPELRTHYDRFKATFGAVRGPWLIALRDPEIAGLTFDVYQRLCPNTKLKRDLFELMVLVVARRFTSQYEWFIHSRLAREYGLPADMIEAVRDRATPLFPGPDERRVYDVVSELVQTWSLGDETYAEAVAALGEPLLVELVTATGFYAMLAMQLNAFKADIPPDAVPLT